MTKTALVLGFLSLMIGRAQTTADSFMFPLSVSWQISQDFGAWNEDWWGYHLGEDVVVNSELPVLAAANGIVIHVGPHSGYGWVVIIEHSLPTGDPMGATVATLYAHMRRSAIIGNGSTVAKGQTIGYLSSNPAENGGYPFTHIHFAVKQLPLSTGCTTQDDPTSNWWVYAGYSSLFTICNKRSTEVQVGPSDATWTNYQSLHAAILARWIPPSAFVKARKVPLLNTSTITVNATLDGHSYSSGQGTISYAVTNPAVSSAVLSNTAIPVLLISKILFAREDLRGERTELSECSLSRS